jgi:DNA-binding response OmpR family regulator
MVAGGMLSSQVHSGEGGSVTTRILVMNDTQELLQLFDDVLSEEGYEVMLSSFAVQDMDEIERVQPDLIILDYIFGLERSGWQTLQKLKLRRTTADIPVIVCTAAIREVRDIEGFLAAKGVVLLPKPFDIDGLLASVSQALHGAQKAAAFKDNEARQAQRETEKKRNRNTRDES